MFYPDGGTERNLLHCSLKMLMVQVIDDEAHSPGSLQGAPEHITATASDVNTIVQPYKCRYRSRVFVSLGVRRRAHRRN